VYSSNFPSFHAGLSLFNIFTVIIAFIQFIPCYALVLKVWLPTINHWAA